jgi:outer membrane lipoprotein-sorting protein
MNQFFLILGLLSLSVGALASSPQGAHIAEAKTLAPAEILKRADDVRNPGDSYLMKVEVVSGSDQSQHSQFEVSVQGNDKTLIKTLEPSRDRGRNMLMRGEEMWAFIPNLNRAVRISLAQKLTGQAANGDISRMRWSGDYTATLENETDKEWSLFLTATKKGLTYEKLRIWIQKGNYHPIKAEFLTLSGKPLKNASYQDYQQIAGNLRPGTIKIQDAVRPDLVSMIYLRDVKVREFPEAVFNQNALR